MAAQRKLADASTFVAPASSKVGPRLAGQGDLGGLNPTLAAQRLQLEAFFTAEEAPVDRYSGPARLAIILGGSAALWTVIAAGAWRLLSAL